MKLISGGICAATGFKANGIHCGIRRNHSKKDLALIVSDVPASAAAVYTTNLVKGAPLTVTKNNIADGIARAVICNSGNANTCNWNGIEIAEGMCALVEQHTGIPAKDVVVASTGVIGQVLDLTGLVEGETLCWDKPAGDWTLQVGFWSRNMGGRRENICIIEEEGVQVLIDAVYEPHWQHYAADFGKTIQGFFSDEPELGNGRTYAKGNRLGTDQDLPWSDEVEAAVAEALGEQWHTKLPLLWEDGPDAPRVRSIYMDIVTKLVRKDFSFQLGDWCQAHGVEYIGHIIEDEGQHLSLIHI